MAMDYVGPFQIAQLNKDQNVATVIDSATLAASINAGIALGQEEAQEYADTRIAEAKADTDSKLPWRGTLPNGTDLNTLRTAGIYTVKDIPAAGTMVNYPTNRAGIVKVWTNDGSSATLQEVIAYVSTAAPTERYSRGTLAAVNTAWSTWASDTWNQGALPDGTNLQTFRNAGAFQIASAVSAATMLDMPIVSGATVRGAGTFETITGSGTGRALQRLTMDVGGTLRVFARSTGLTGSWPAWQELGVSTGGGGSAPATTVANVMRDSAHRHGILRNHFKARRGGVIGTGGLGVYCIRIDHWLEDFERDMLPTLRKYALPATLAMNGDNFGTHNNGPVTPETVQSWALYDGIPVANHSATHQGTNAQDGIIDEIIGGQQRLQAKLPKLVIDEWHMPGIASDIAYDGFGNGNRLEVWTDTLAGKAILHSHAHASGYMQGFWHELTGEPQIGEMPQGQDDRAVADRINDVKQIQRMGKGLVHLIHGNVIASGKMTLADWETFCAFLAAERDAGRLLVLTTAGEAMASSRTNYRAQIVQNATWGESWSDWTGTAGWTVANPGTPGAVAACSGTAGMLTQALLIHSRHGWCQGGTMEMVAQVRATGGTFGKFAFELYDMSNRANFDRKKSVSVPSSGEWVWVRMNVTIPRVGDLTQMRFSFGRDGTGGPMEVKNLAFQPI